MIPVSAVIIARDEEKNIGRCLRSLAWADEILVVDGMSRDRTVEICETNDEPWTGKVRVIRREWCGFRDQRNFSIREARNDWVFVVDADEECSPELAARLRDLLSMPGGPPQKAYKVRRIEYLIGKPIHHGMWNPSYQDRFFHRAGVEYVNEVHEYPRFPSPPHDIHEPLHHSLDFTPEKIVHKMNKYTTLEARDRVLRGQRTNWFHLIFTFPAMSFKSYFYYGAYKDGMPGLIISLLEGVSRVVRHIKMWQFAQDLDASDSSRSDAGRSPGGRS